jgi:2-polyprenyl-3-methyl-5-hydroxy-6-metoxy-1,4-benzoquinol methylase
MIQDSSTLSWNQLSAEWCDIAPTNETRINFIMPYMLSLLRDVSGKRILDLGCGEGGYSRELTRRNADVVAVDCAEFSIEYAKKQSLKDGFDIKYYIRNSNDLYDIELLTMIEVPDNFIEYYEAVINARTANELKSL